MIASPSVFSHALDNRGPLRAPEGILRFSGWLTGPGGEMQVRLRLGPNGVFDCRTGLPRPDVASAHPECADAEFSGFDLETYVPIGFHIGTLEFRASGDTRWVGFHTLSIAAGPSPLFAQLESAAALAEGCGDWPVRGWCFHPQGEIECISVQFGSSEAAMQHGALRPDVAATFPQFRTATDSGFSGILPLRPGQGPIKLKVKLRDGTVLQRVLLPEWKIPDRALEQTVRAALAAPCAGGIKFKSSP